MWKLNGVPVEISDIDVRRIVDDALDVRIAITDGSYGIIDSAKKSIVTSTALLWSQTSVDRLTNGCLFVDVAGQVYRKTDATGYERLYTERCTDIVFPAQLVYVP